MPGTGHRRISMTKEVIVKISGFQLLDGEQDAVEIITAGDYYQKNGRHYIVYEEAMEGFEGSTRNIVKVSPQKMDIMKTGIVNAHMVFEKNQKATTRYITPMGEMVVGMSTNQIDLEEQEDRLKICVNYSLDINYDHVSDCNIVMDVLSKNNIGLEL